MKQRLVKTKNYIVRNKTNIAVGIGVTLVIAGLLNGQNKMLSFIKDKDLYPEFLESLG